MLLVGVVAEQIAQEGRSLVEAARGVLGGPVVPEQPGVGGARRLQGVRTGGEFAGRGAQQGLRLLGVGGHPVLGQLGVRLPVLGGQALGLAPEAAELLARLGGTRLQHLDEGLGAGGSRLPGRAVGAVRGLQELFGAGADLVGEAVELGEGGGLVALGAGLLGAQVGADADLLVQLGGGR